MAKDPAFLFYPNDWIGGTMGMSFEEKGAYMELLMMQFNRGHMTYHMMGQTVGQLLDKVLDKFVKDQNGLYYNVRLEEEKNKRKRFVDSRLNNKKGKNQHSKKEGHTGGHMTSHMENVNIDTSTDDTKEDSLNNYIGEKEKKSEEDMIVIEMVKVWKASNFDYQFEKELDYPACLQLAYKIARAKGWRECDVIRFKEHETIESWKKIVAFIKEDDFYWKFSLSQLVKQWQSIHTKMSNPKRNTYGNFTVNRQGASIDKATAVRQF